MEILKAVADLLGAVAWPVTAVVLVLIFRKDIKDRLRSVREVSYPGGAITLEEVVALETAVNKVVPESQPAMVQERGVLDLVTKSDDQLAVIQQRVDIERTLFLLSQRALESHADVPSWTVQRHINELELGAILAPEIAQSLRAFIDLSNRVVHSGNIQQAIASKAATIGSALVATLRRLSHVREGMRDFWGHGLWHQIERSGRRENRHEWWAAVADTMPVFAYDYSVYKDAAEAHNRRVRSEPGTPRSHEVHMLTRDEFLSVLKFREQQLLDMVHGHRSHEEGEWNRWKWPEAWGIEWNCTILHNPESLWEAEKDLMITRQAIEGLRGQQDARPA